MSFYVPWIWLLNYHGIFVMFNDFFFKYLFELSFLDSNFLNNRTVTRYDCLQSPRCWTLGVTPYPEWCRLSICFLLGKRKKEDVRRFEKKKKKKIKCGGSETAEHLHLRICSFFMFETKNQEDYKLNILSTLSLWQELICFPIR